MNTTQQLIADRYKLRFPTCRSIIRLVESVRTPSPALLFTAAIGLYTTLCILEDCHERFCVTEPARDWTELFDTSRSRNTSAEGLQLDQIGPKARSHCTACDLRRLEASRGETDFADIEINTRRFPASILVKQTSSNQNASEDFDQLLSFSDLNPRLSKSQIQTDFAPRYPELQFSDESREQVCPQTPRLSFADYPATPDSGYYSHASPRSVCEAISPSIQGNGSRHRDVVDMHLEPEEHALRPNLCVPSSKVPKPPRRSAISLDHFVDCDRTGSSLDLDITVLDTETGLRVPLSKGLSTKDMRGRTGLLTSLRTAGDERELRVRELIPWDKLDSVKADISIWDSQRETFQSLSTVLMTPEARHCVNVYIERRPNQLDTTLPRGQSMSWPNLVKFLDISGFYLGQLQEDGVDLCRQVNIVMEQPAKLCIRTKVVA